jgi:hypothetical protein
MNYLIFLSLSGSIGNVVWTTFLVMPIRFRNQIRFKVN